MVYKISYNVIYTYRAGSGSTLTGGKKHININGRCLLKLNSTPDIHPPYTYRTFITACQWNCSLRCCVLCSILFHMILMVLWKGDNKVYLRMYIMLMHVYIIIINNIMYMFILYIGKVYSVVEKFIISIRITNRVHVMWKIELIRICTDKRHKFPIITSSYYHRKLNIIIGIFNVFPWIIRGKEGRRKAFSEGKP